MRASIGGLIFLALSRVLCLGVSLAPGGLILANALHAVAPFPYIGTALGAPLLAFAAMILVNYFVPTNVAGDWLYHSDKFDPMETLLLRSAFGVPPDGEISKRRLIIQQISKVAGNVVSFFWAVLGNRSLRASWRRLKTDIRQSRKSSSYSFGQLTPIMLNMSDSKVYVGYVAEIPPVEGGHLKFVRVLPIWSGYRSSDTKEVVYVTSYLDDLQRNDVDHSRLAKVLPSCEIASASIYVDGLFKIRSSRSKTRAKAGPKRARPHKKI